MLKRVLRSAGYQVLEAPDGRVGTLLYKSKRPDLVITDILMPEKEGIETITELRKEFSKAKILAISGGGMLDQSQYLEIAKTSGASDTLAKPFENEDLLYKIQKLTG